jgi:nicotinate-nucleotide pyrophosphorylase (carboxylating)
MSAPGMEDGRIVRIIESALLEDVGMGDLTGDATIPEQQLGEGTFLCKAEGVVAGLDIASLVFSICDESAEFERVVEDGTQVHPGQPLAYVRGSARGLLRAERTALNFLQRMSGIATATRAYVDAVRGTRAKITDTRKTVPGLRLLDKMAVRIGGGVNHRFGLDDMVLIKDNHIAAAGGIPNAVDRCMKFLKQRGITVGVEVETTSLGQVNEALQCAGVTRIMLDNMDVATMTEAVNLIARRVEVEASGGISFATVRHIAETGVDVISIGALTHSVHALDISLELAPHAG